MARLASNERRALSSSYSTSYTTVKLTFAEAIAKVMANEMTATELFRQLPAELRKEIDERCGSAFKKEFSLISSEQQKMVLVALLAAASPNRRRKGTATRVMVKAVLGIFVGLMLAGLLWAASHGLHWAFTWDLGMALTASLGWWISWPAGGTVCAIGVGVWRDNKARRSLLERTTSWQD